jgi:hypothetical protein
MNTMSWISFHSYLPNFYIAENNFFYSGQNNCCEDFDFLVGELVPNPSTTTTTSTSTSSTTTTTTTVTPLQCNFAATVLETNCSLAGTGVIQSIDCDLAGTGQINGTTTTTTSTSTTSTTTSTTSSTTTTTTSSSTTTTTTSSSTTTTTTTATPTTTTTTTATPTTTTTTTAGPCNCFTYDVIIGQEDLDDATGNTDPGKDNGVVYVEYTNCEGIPTTSQYSVANTYLNSICVDTNALTPTIYYYKNNTQTAPSTSSTSITANDCCVQ